VSYCVDLNEVHFEKYVRDYSKEYFTIEALETGNVYFRYHSFASTEDQRYMEYSKDDGETWNRITNVDGDEVVMTISLTEGEKALVRGDNDTFEAFYEDLDDWYNCHFYSDIEFNAYGNIMSLIHGDAFVGETTVTENMFRELFFDRLGDDTTGDIYPCGVANASNLILPATTLDNGCYQGMFSGCSSLTTAPELPAEALDNNCYFQMFYGCSSLTTAPELPATTLADACYGGMFYGCSNLNYIKAMFTTTPSTTYTNGWVNGVAANGTFVKNSAATWDVTGVNGIPSGWTVQTASA